jgi:hypothetical protein
MGSSDEKNARVCLRSCVDCFTTRFFATVQKEMGRIDAHNYFFENFLAPVHNGKQ